MMPAQSKKILVTIPWFTPAYKAGGPVQSVLNMVNHIHEACQFEIITSDRDVDGAILNGITTDQSISFNNNTLVKYLSKNQLFKGVKNNILHSDAQVIFINGIYSFYFNLLPLFFFKGERIIVSARGMLHPPALQQKWLKKKIYLSLLKPLLKFKKATFHATDATEALHIQSIMGNNAKVFVAPNIPRLFPASFTEKKTNALHLLTVALISPMKNHLLVLQALKAIKANVVYDIVGPVFDADYWAECQKQIAQLPDNIIVNYHGPIPPTALDEFYTTAHVFICPSQSENFGHALFEALSAGKPLLTSKHTPWNDLQKNEMGCNMEIAVDAIRNSIQLFADMDQDTYRHWSHRAAVFARDYEGLKIAHDAYIQMFQA